MAFCVCPAMLTVTCSPASAVPQIATCRPCCNTMLSLTSAGSFTSALAIAPPTSSDKTMPRIRRLPDLHRTAVLPDATTFSIHLYSMKTALPMKWEYSSLKSSADTNTAAPFKTRISRVEFVALVRCQPATCATEDPLFAFPWIANTPAAVANGKFFLDKTWRSQ